MSILRRVLGVAAASGALLVPLAGTAHAAGGYPPCGDACNLKDPQTFIVNANGSSYHCADDAVTIDSFLYQGRTIQLRYSNRCETIWGRGYGLYNGDVIYSQVKDPITGGFFSDGTIAWDYEYSGPGDGWTPCGTTTTSSCASAMPTAGHSTPSIPAPRAGDRPARPHRQHHPSPGGIVRNRTALRIGTLAAAATLGLLMTATGQASAGSGSTSSSFTNGATLTANIWMATWASGGCADFSSSAVISGGPNPQSGHDWVKNTTTFDPWGVAPSVTAFGRSGDPVSGSWTNDNGSRGAYLDGNLCTNWRTVGVEGSTTASAFYNGQTKIVTAST